MRRELPVEARRLKGDARKPESVKEALKGLTFDVVADFISVYYIYIRFQGREIFLTCRAAY